MISSKTKIREIEENDAAEFLNLCKKIDSETDFMLREADERTATEEEQRNQIKKIKAEDNQMIFIAENDGSLVGYLAAFGGGFKRIRNTAHIVIGILQKFTGLGIGTELFVKMEKWAKQRKIHRLELTVRTDNEKGLALYKKMGFETEGVRKHALLINGSYMDEYRMFKLL